ncbi:MAG TPA: endonuclease V [Tepidisphaeraceae bacterium]|jgi:deoxyribonuclease V|nr:endonuclease V [Tepidisphaeraceae bacterium]
MRGKHDPDWKELVAHWKQTQNDLRAKLIVQPLDPLPRFVAGVDAAYSSDKSASFAAAVVYDRKEQRIVEVAHAVALVEIPYIPGFLSFREGPLIMAALAKLTTPFGAVCFDGQGYAHPRRCGLASHVGIMLDMPSVGVAKTRFIGTHEDPPGARGESAALMDKAEQIGLVLRTRDATNPLYISIGHRVDLPTARDLVLACCTKYRVPEPTRQADIEVAKLKKMKNEK